MKFWLILMVLSIARPIFAQDPFYVYTERGSRLNHYCPSGWMGAFNELQMNVGFPDNAVKSPDKKTHERNKKTSIEIVYTAERLDGTAWAGIYWQQPCGNWGDQRGGIDLSGYKKLTFYARGKDGGEEIDKFFVGGITGTLERGDSDSAAIYGVQLTKEWQKYEIDLDGDFSYIIGGFGIAANADLNMDGFTIYLDEIRFE